MRFIDMTKAFNGVRLTDMVGTLNQNKKHKKSGKEIQQLNRGTNTR